MSFNGETPENYHNLPAKYRISESMRDSVMKVRKARKLPLSLHQVEGENNNWQILCRALLAEGAGHMNQGALKILAGCAGNFTLTMKQKKAIIAIAKAHCPTVTKRIRLDGEQIERTN